MYPLCELGDQESSEVGVCFQRLAFCVHRIDQLHSPFVACRHLATYDVFPILFFSSAAGASISNVVVPMEACVSRKNPVHKFDDMSAAVRVIANTGTVRFPVYRFHYCRRPIVTFLKMLLQWFCRRLVA